MLTEKELYIFFQTVRTLTRHIFFEIRFQEGTGNLNDRSYFVITFDYFRKVS